jgi:uncharacterized membrane protein
MVASAVSGAGAQVQLIESLPGYSTGSIRAMSDDGSVLAIDMLQPDSWGYDAFLNDAGNWAALPRYGLWNQVMGISSDGAAAIVTSTQPGSFSRLTHSVDGRHTDIWTSTGDFPVFAAITGNGRSVLYGIEQHDGSFRIDRWREGKGSGSLLDLSGVVGLQRVLAGNSDERFVFSANPSATEVRSYLYDGGIITDLGSVGSDPMSIIATDMSADGSVIVGSASGAASGVFTQDAWIWRDGQMTTLALDGLSHLSIASVSDDGAWMVGSSVPPNGDASTFLLGENGDVLFAADLLASHGFSIGADQHAYLLRVSGDGSTVAGLIQDGGFSGTHTYFTLRIPAPGPLGAFALAGLAACRRRR